jgi:hypothetical protein
MALRINKQIGTNKGITSDGYVRIENISLVAKQGILKINTLLYMNEDAALSASKDDEVSEVSAKMVENDWQAESVDVKFTYEFALTSSELRTRNYSRYEDVSQSVNYYYPNPENPDEILTGSRWEYSSGWVTGSEQYVANVVDLSTVIENSIYDVAYPLLKVKLEETFGVGNIESI